MIDAPLIRPPRPQAVRMAAWAPAARVAGAKPGRKSLGFSPNFDGTTIMAAVAGGGAIFIADTFDAPFSTLVKIGGFVSLGFAAYNAFSGVLGPSGAPGAPAPVHSLPGPDENNPQGSANDLRGSIIVPQRDGSADTGFVGMAYPIQFSIRNAGKLPISTIVQFKTREFTRVTKAQDSRVTGYSVSLNAGETKVIDGTQPYAFGWSFTFDVDVVAELVATVSGGKMVTLATSSFKMS